MINQRVKDLNYKSDISSVQKLLEVLEELRIIDGEIISDSVLKRKIENLGASDPTDINQTIEDLTEEESDKTSVVDEGKIKELVAEYKEYINNGLSEKEALRKIQEKNNENISAKEIERLIQRQSEIYRERKIEVRQDFIPEKEEFKEEQKKENKNDNDDLVEKFIDRKKTEVKDELEEKEEIDEIIEEKSNEVAQKIIKELSNNNERVEELINRKRTEFEKELKKTVKKVFSGEETTLGNGIIKVIQERDDSFITQKIPINNSSIKAIQLELNDWINKNEKQVIEYKGKILEKKIKTEIFKKNPELTKEEKNNVEDYTKFVKNFYSSTKIVNINQNREKIVTYAENVGLSPGQIGNGWNNLQAFTGLINSNQKPLGLIDQYKNLVEKIGNKIPTGIKECDSLNVVIKMAEKSDNFRHLIEKTQSVLNWKGNLISSVASKLGLDKFVANMAGKVLGEEFVKNSLVILSQKSLEQGSFIILQSFIGGGTQALAVTAATITVQTAQAALLAAQAALTGAQTLLTGAVTTAEIAAATAKVAMATEALSLASQAAITANTALATVTEVAGATATEIGTIAATGIVPVVGWILAALMAISTIFKPVFDKVKNFLSDIGLNFTKGIKKFLEENFGLLGKLGSFVINLGEDIVIMAGTALAAITVGPIVLIFFLILGGLFGYQPTQRNLVSSLVPPKGTNDKEQIITVPEDPLKPIDPLIPNDPLLPESCPSGWPARLGYTSYITQGPLGTASHDGQQAIDIVINDPNLYVLATSPGTISYTNASSCGLGIIITSDCGGQNGRMVKTIYCHLSEMYVTPGQIVTRGYVLGKEGTTGSSSAPHLHYEVMYGGDINNYLPVDVPQFCYRCLSF